MLALVVVVSLVSAGATWVAASRWAERSTDGPASVRNEPEMITGQVRRGDLVEVLALPGRVVAERSTSISAPAAEGKAVVTELSVSAGKVVSEGDRVASVSDRPILVLGGVLQPYRDLRPGDTGSDVFQLRNALVRLGFLAESPGDSYDEAMKDAVRGLYERARSAPVEYQPEGLDEASLRRAVTDAEASVEAARLALDLAGYASAKEERTAARDSLAGFLAASGPLVPASELAFVEGLPLVVGTFAVKLGQPVEVGKAILTMTSNEGHVAATATPSQGAQLEAGMPAALEATDGEPLPGLVAEIGPPSKETGDVEVVVALAQNQTPGLLGKEGQVLVTVAATKDALVVPISALADRPGAGAYVSRLKRGEVTRIDVEVGTVVDGEAAVTTTSGTLEEGDRIVLG